MDMKAMKEAANSTHFESELMQPSLKSNTSLVSNTKESANDSEVPSATTKDDVKLSAAENVTQEAAPSSKEIARNQEQEAAAEAETNDVLRNMMQMNEQFNATAVRALHQANRSLGQIEGSVRQILTMMIDAQSKPELSILKKEAAKNGSTDLDAGKIDPEGRDALGSIGDMLGGLLGGGIAAALGAKAKGVLDKVRGKKPDGAGVPKPSTVKSKPPTVPKPGTVAPATAAKATPKTTVPDAPKPKSLGGAMSGAFKSAKGVGKLGLLAAGGAAAYAGAQYMFSGVGESIDNANEKRRITVEEIEMQNARRLAGTAPMEGEELLAFRSAVTRQQGWEPDPYSGFPMTALQSEAVAAGIATPKQAVETDNTELYQALLAKNGVVHSEMNNSSGMTEQSGSNSNTVAGLAAAGAGVYATHKLSTVMSPTSGIQTPPVVTTEAKPISATQVQTASAPTKSEMTRIKTGIESAADNASAKAPEKMGGKGMLKSAGGKALPVLGTAMTAYEAYDIWQDEEASTKKKLGKTADLAGGTAGAILGAKAGATGGAAVGAAIGAFFFGAGAVPGAAIGAAIGGIGGGIAGYMGGESITRNAREWLFGEDDDTTGVLNSPSPMPASANDSAMVVEGQTEKAFDAIVRNSTSSGNPDVARFTNGTMPTLTAPVGSKAANNDSFSMVPKGSYGSTSTVANSASSNMTKYTTSNFVPTTPAPSAASASAASYLPDVSVASAAPSTVAQSAPAAVANVRSQVVNEQEPVRAQYTTIKEVKSLDPAVPQERVRSTDEAQKALGLTRSSNTVTSVTKIDDIPSVMNDGGLGLMNTSIL